MNVGQISKHAIWKYVQKQQVRQRREGTQWQEYSASNLVKPFWNLSKYQSYQNLRKRFKIIQIVDLPNQI